jgi:formyl-CoA transferase
VAVDPRFVRNSARVQNRESLNAVLSSRFAELEEDTARRLLAKAGVAYARVNDVRGLLDHPVLAGRDRWRTVATPGGPVQTLLPPASAPGRETRMDPVPALGQHTDAILASLGYSTDQISALHAKGLV